MGQVQTFRLRATRTICRRIMSPSMATVSLSPK